MISILDPSCPAWYRRYVEGKRVKIRKRRPGRKPGALCKREKRNRTGCIGISIVRLKNGRRYFSVCPDRRKFSIDSLGKEEAWRRALKRRSDYELSLKRKEPA